MEAEALNWLLEPADPPIRLLTLTDVLNKSPDDEEVKIARAKTLSYRPVQRLKRAQGNRGYWPPDDTCYTPKFSATVWPLILLGEMGVPRTSWMESACERFLEQHQMENGAFSWKSKLGRGKVEEEVCLTGNMARTLIALGYGDDDRIKRAVNWLPEFQLDDGGWNCDYPKYDVKHSSLMSTIQPLWAYSEIPRSRWTRKIKRSVELGAEFLLMHRLFKSDHHEWRPVELRHMNVFRGNLVTSFHFPMYYYYDALLGLRLLTRLGYSKDERTEDTIHLILSKKTPDGKWLLDGDWVRERTDNTRKTLVTIEQLMKPSKWVTLNCYRVLAKTGELKLPHGLGV